MSDFEFRLSPYETCAEEVMAFRNANRAIVRDRNYFEWRYVRRPCRQKAMIVWGIDGGGRKVAAASVIPHDFHVLDGVHPVGVLGDISVAPECRGRGIATQMLQFLQIQPAFSALIAGLVLPNDEASHALNKAGWRDATAVARLVKIIDIRPRLPGRLGRWASMFGISHAYNRLSSLTSLDGWSPRRPSPYRAAEVDGFDEGFDELWSEIPKRGRILAVRDRPYLHWRYHEHPTVRYRILGLRHENRLRGYIVFHVDAGAVEVDDFLTAGADVSAWLVRELLMHVRKERLAATIHARYNLGSFLAVPWTRFGFVPRRDFHRVMVSASRTVAHPSLAADAAWFVTAGDKDV